MPRLSITLTESQSAALERIAAETGATKQSMIGLAVSAWIRANDTLPAEPNKAPENRPQEPERYINVERDGVEVAWLRGRWETPEKKAVIATAMRFTRDGQLQEMGGKSWRYQLAPNESYWEEDLYPED